LLSWQTLISYRRQPSEIPSPWSLGRILACAPTMERTVVIVMEIAIAVTIIVRDHAVTVIQIVVPIANSVYRYATDLVLWKLTTRNSN